MFTLKKCSAIISITVCLICIEAAIAAAPLIHVDAVCGDDSWTGQIPECFGPDGFKRTIQAALDAVSDDGMIIVSPGIYSGDGNRDLDFKGKTVHLLGSESNILCEGTPLEPHRAFHFHSGENENTVVAGFTMVAGCAWKGGAVLCENSSPTFLNCTFQENKATDDDTGGGAVYNENSSPTFELCTFRNNQTMPSASYGGAVSNRASHPSFVSCTFVNNIAWMGGGIYNSDQSNPTLDGCHFSENQASRGGAIGNSQSSPTIFNCYFNANLVINYGGAINNTGQSNPVIDNCIFTHNSGVDGAAIANWSSSPEMTDCLFAANAATRYAGAICNDASFTRVMNCTIYGNTAPSGGAIAAYDDSGVTVSSSIIWGNTDNQIYIDAPDCLSMVFSCIQDGWVGIGNVISNPRFINPEGPDGILGNDDDDFSLAENSPCINAGNPSYAPEPGDTDLAGEPRLFGGIVDMGAYESQEIQTPEGVIYVDSSATGANNGSNWANAFNHLQDALAVAMTGNEIRIAQGTYKPDLGVGVARYDRLATFQLKSNVTIKGGYAGVGSPTPDMRDIEGHPTVLSGDLAGNDGPDFADSSENSFHVVTGTDAQEAVLDGLTITSGNANGSYPHNNGGGVVIEYTGGSPVLVDCTISNSYAQSGGGGLYVCRNGVAALTRCTFFANKSGYTGGGLYNYKGEGIELYRCTFRGNSAANAGALSNFLGSMAVRNCVISGNTAQVYSGGQGGAMRHWGNSSADQLVLVNSTISGNSAVGTDGPGQCGGLYVQDGPANIDNCIFWGNSDADGQGQLAQIVTMGGESVVSNCCIQGYSSGENANISADPLLADPDGIDNISGTEDDNLRLLPGSPCIDAGKNSVVTEPFMEDMDGNPRIQNDIVDIGAYEGISRAIIVSQQFITVPEGQIVSFTAHLSSDPGGTIEVSLTHSGDTDIELETGPRLYFDSSNYHLPQTVELIGATDPDPINGIAQIHLTAPGFFGAGVTATELDSDSSSILYVDDDATPPGNGLSWGTAFSSLQDALSAVAQYPQFNEIRVAQGTYKPDQGAGYAPGSRDATFQLINNVTLKGGYTGLSGPDSDTRDFALNRSILSGDLAGNDIQVANPADLLDEPTRDENSRNVVTATDCGNTAVIDGFTITGGNADGPAEAQKYGGGIYNGMPTVKNCTIADNSADIGGGAAYFYYGLHGLVADCIVAHNAAPSGGGIYGCPTLSNCVINANAATDYSGGGLFLGQGCDTTVTDCIFSNNSAVAHGGGVMLGVSESTPIFTRCVFIGNSTEGSGGAAASDGCTCGSYPEFHQCTFIANTAGEVGGGIHSFGYSLPKLFSCLLTGNHSGTNGGAFSHGWGSGSYFANCTITHNAAGQSAGGIFYEESSNDERTVANCIIWGNSDQAGQTLQDKQIYVAPTAGIPSVNYSCIEGWTGIGGTGSVGNIAQYPKFVDADGPDDTLGNEDDNLRLQPDSPCVNRGSDDYVLPNSSDLDGNPRILAGRVDMGAYESPGPGEPGEPARYDIIDLGTLGGDESMAHAINNNGQIVGWARRYPHPISACLFDFRNPANNLDLDPYGGDSSGAYSINIHGVSVGTARVTQTAPFNAVIFDHSDPCDNLYLNGSDSDYSSAQSINDSGQIVGFRHLLSGGSRATLFDPSGSGNNIDLTAGGLSNSNGTDDSSALSINNRGQIVGYARYGTTSVHQRAILFDPTGAGDNIILTPDEEDEGEALCINDTGQIVGWSTRTGGATLFNQADPGNNLALGKLPDALDSKASSINNRGQIVGSVRFWEEALSYYDHAALFDATGNGENKDLNELIEHNTGWELLTAHGINDAGWIVGYGRYAGGTRAFLLIPKQSATLVAHWKFDESEGDIAEDSAGDNDGTLHGGPLWLPNEGRVDGALLFDGTDDYVDCGNSSDFDITDQISIAAWVNISAVNTDWQTVVAKGDSAWRLSTAEDEYRYHFAVTGGPPWNYINGDIVVEPGEWHHVCGTYDGAYLRLYIDCIEDSAGPVAEANGVTTSEHAVYIGENQEKPGRFWDGLIDDVRVYSYALTRAEISELCKIDVLYVDKDARGRNNGCCWGDAFQCLQDALAAATDGTEIRVAEGTYKPDCGAGIATGDREATFQLKNGVTIKGGYAGNGQPQPSARDIDRYQTILSGDLAGNDETEADPSYYDESSRPDNSYHVVTGSAADPTAILDGCTITAGQSNFYGGGMYNAAGSPTLVDCIFTLNAAEMGGGIYNTDRSNPSITRCTFTGNAIYYDYDGAAMANTNQSSPQLTDCVFTNNVAPSGTAVLYNYQNSSPTLTACVFTNNIALFGTMYNYVDSNPVLSRCLFLRNSSSPIYNNHSSPTVSNCIFAKNESYDGAGMHNYNSSPILTNCTFTGNTARNKCGGVYSRGDSHPMVTNSIFWHNSAAEPLGQELYTEYYYGYAASTTISFSSIEGGLGGIFVDAQSTLDFGPGNTAQDPCFVDPEGDDYHLKSTGWRWDRRYEEWTFDRVTSRCIDTGNPGSPLLDEPLSVPDDPNNEYAENIRINMGAYGGTAEASLPPIGWSLLADINNDGIVNFCDFACAGADWNVNAPHTPGDLDRNKGIAPPDLSLLADDWLTETSWRR